MTLGTSDEIFKLRIETKKLIRKAEDQALDANATKAQAEAFDRLAIELSDLDSTLYEAPFLKNDTQIRKLVAEINAATEAAQKLNFELAELKTAIKDARAEIRGATAKLPQAKALLDEVDALLALLT